MNYISSVLVLKIAVFAAGDGAIFRNQLKCKNCNTFGTKAVELVPYLCFSHAKLLRLLHPSNRYKLQCNIFGFPSKAYPLSTPLLAHSKWMRCVIGVICIRRMQNTPIALEFSGSPTGTPVSLSSHSAVSKTVSRRT